MSDVPKYSKLWQKAAKPGLTFASVQSIINKNHQSNLFKSQLLADQPQHYTFLLMDVVRHDFFHSLP